MLNECSSSPLKVWSNQSQGNLSAPLSRGGSPDSLGWDVEKGWSNGSHQVGDTLEFHGKGRYFPPPYMPFPISRESLAPAANSQGVTLIGNQRPGHSRGESTHSPARSLISASQITLLVWHFFEQIPFFLICRPVEWYLGWETIVRDYLSQLISWWIKKQVQRGGVLLRY